MKLIKKIEIDEDLYERFIFSTESADGQAHYPGSVFDIACSIFIEFTRCEEIMIVVRRTAEDAGKAAVFMRGEHLTQNDIESGEESFIYHHVPLGVFMKLIFVDGAICEKSKINH